MASARKRFYVTMSHTLPEEARDVRKKLRHAKTWRDGKSGGPDEWATGSVDLTPSEVEKVEAASNVLYIEEVHKMDFDVDASVPADRDLRSHKMDMLHEWGFTGAGIDVGVIDEGIGSGALGKFNVKATRAFGGTTLHGTPDHGSGCASLAVPRQAKLVFGAATLSDEVYDAIYWMADTVGIHVLSMSFGSYEFRQGFADAIAHAKTKSIAIFASAGNDSTRNMRYPASYTGVVSVGALDRTAGWKRASFSNFGAWVDLWVNGVSVATYDGSGNLTSPSGTSYATPLAAYVHASLLTKGLTSIGQISTEDSVKRGGDPAPSGVGGGKRLNGRDGAFRMRDFCA